MDRNEYKKKRFTHAVKFLIICWQCNNFSISRRKEEKNNTKQSIPKKFFSYNFGGIERNFFIHISSWEIPKKYFSWCNAHNGIHWKWFYRGSSLAAWTESWKDEFFRFYEYLQLPHLYLPKITRWKVIWKVVGG